MISPDTDIDWFIRKYYLNEPEALPLSYLHEISIIGDQETEGQAAPDPISTIFWDENFTGITNQKSSDSGIKISSTDLKKKDKKDKT
jgi:hypothetical protein